jgi:hypothetical protein
MLTKLKLLNTTSMLPSNNNRSYTSSSIEIYVLYIDEDNWTI